MISSCKSNIMRELRNNKKMSGLDAYNKEGWNPIWNSSLASNHPPTAGLWAVEPHLGFRDVGAKWEELLVITEDDAFWLDDDVPHVRRWQKRGLWPQEQAQ